MSDGRWLALDEEGFDDLIAVMAAPPLTGGPTVSLDEYYQSEWTAAMADPVGWMRENGQGIRETSKRPMVRLLLRRHPEARRLLQDGDEEAIQGLLAGTTSAEAIVGMSDEDKKKWYDRIQRFLIALKIAAAVIPPPYSFAVMAFAIGLALFAEKRLKPQELAALFAAYRGE